MSLGTNISFLRKQKKMTQEQFAEIMNVTRQTVSRWESDEVIPELVKLVDMCTVFTCKLDTLVRENLSIQNDIYSEIQVVKVAPFKMASYVAISPYPEDDVYGYMDRWATNSGLKSTCSDAKIIGYDFPFVSQEQQNRFGMRGYVAAYVIPKSFETDYKGVQYSENKEANYAVITITEPFIQSFDRIPNAYKAVNKYIQDNGFKIKQQENVISCFEYVYKTNNITYMDVYIHLDGVSKVNKTIKLD